MTRLLLQGITDRLNDFLNFPLSLDQVRCIIFGLATDSGLEQSVRDAAAELRAEIDHPRTPGGSPKAPR